jgi:CHAD domain-containing protein
MPAQPVPLEKRPTALLDTRVRAVFRHLPPALGGDEESIHQVRVAGRRLRATLPLLAPKPDGRRVRRSRRNLRALIRTAATCRDLDVCATHFDGSVAADEQLSADARLLRRRLRAARNRSCRRMAEALLDLDLRRLRRDLRVLLARGAEAPETVWTRIGEMRDVTAEEAFAMIRELGDRFDPEALHLLRTRVRRLRYVAELDAELRDEPTRAAKPLKAVQEQLGEIHDAFVLSAWLGKQALSAERRMQAALAAEARRLEARFLEASRAHHRAYLEQDPVRSIRTALRRMGRGEPTVLRVAQ